MTVCRDECVKHENQVAQLESKLRNMEAMLQAGADTTLVGPVGGLCIQCAQNDALLPAPVALTHKHHVDSLTRFVDVNSC